MKEYYKRALTLLEQNQEHLFCNCSIAKEYGGYCHKHGLIFVGKHQAELIRETFKQD